MKFFILVLALCLSGCWKKHDPFAGAPSVANFVLIGDNDQAFVLSRNQDVKALVFISSSVGCPILRKYYEEIEKINREFSGKIRLFYVDPQAEHLSEEAIKERADFKITVPLLFDPSQEVSRLLQFTRSSEVAVVETGKMRLVYRGAIDDRIDYTGEASRSKQSFLRDNLKRIVAGENVEHDFAPAKGCAISYDKVDPDFFTQVKPVLDQKCVMCHFGGAASPDLSSPEIVKRWSAMIHDVLLLKLMPPYIFDSRYGPYEFVSDGAITPAEEKVIYAWIRGEQKLGSPKVQSEAKILRPWERKIPVAFQVKEFTQAIPANGNEPFRYFEAFGPAEKDFFVTAVQFKAEPRRAFAHLRLLVLNRSLLQIGQAGDLHELLYRNSSPYLKGKFGYTPKAAGNHMPMRELTPKGTGILVRKGDFLAFEAHLKTTGKPEVVSLGAGISTAPVKSKLRPLYLQYVAQSDLSVPAGKRDVKFTKEIVLDEDIELHRLVLHQHLRGVSGKIWAKSPDGKTTVLLSMPYANPDALNKFSFLKPVHLTKGARIFVEGVYDNSKYLERNPDSSSDVGWGPDYEKQEMLGGELYFTKWQR